MADEEMTGTEQDEERSDEDELRELFSDIMEFESKPGEHEAEIEAAEEAADDEDTKLARKLDKRVGDMEARFERSMLKQSIDSFVATADEIERSLMREIAGDIKSVSEFERAQRVVAKQAEKLRSKAAALEAQAMEMAQDKATRAWGLAPIGGSPAAPNDHEKEVIERIATGDRTAAARAFFGGDAMMGQFFGN